MNGLIYVIKNSENDKVYVGKTFKNIDSRFRQHIRDSRKVKNELRKLYRAIRKYGEDKFWVELLEGEIDEVNLSEKEIYYINKHNSYKCGYNNTLGGDGARYLECTDEEVINTYKEVKSVKEAAKVLGISTDSTSLILKNNGIKIRDPRSVYVYINELDLEFENMTKCVEYLYDKGYTKAKEPKNVKTNIKRSIDRNGTYLGFTYKLYK